MDSKRIEIDLFNNRKWVLWRVPLFSVEEVELDVRLQDIRLLLLACQENTTSDNNNGRWMRSAMPKSQQSWVRS